MFGTWLGSIASWGRPGCIEGLWLYNRGSPCRFVCEHHHEHDGDDDCDCHDHEHEHHHGHDGDDDCDCHDHEHEHHHGHDGDDDCCCPDCADDDVGEISLCGCPDCADDDDDGDDELFAEGKPLIANRPIQIILASGILFALGHVFEWLSFSPTIVTITYMVGAVIAGY